MHIYHATPASTPVSEWQSWYHEVFSELAGTLKSSLDANSPLLAHINDFALLLRTEYPHDVIASRTFDLKELLDTSLARVKTHYPHAASIIRTSMQPSMPHLWHGPADMVEALLRHLLMIACERSQEGIIFLRLEADSAIRIQDKCLLRIKLEDSGPSLQRSQLREWLKKRSEDMAPCDHHQPFSWKLTSRLLHLLDGGASAENGPDGGLKFIGWVPLVPASTQATLPLAQPRPLTPAQDRLVLVAEPHLEKRQQLSAGLEKEHCRTFFVDNHQELLEWVVSIPVSAILLNADIPCGKPSLVAQVKQTMAPDDMQDIPLALLTSRTYAPSIARWQEAGLRDIVEIPSEHAVIQEWCMKLPVRAPDFYRNQQPGLLEDLPQQMQSRLPELTAEFTRQVMHVVKRFRMYELSDTLKKEVHAVRSAALTLGYFHVAALMAQIEYTVNANTLPDNADVIAHYLQFFDKAYR